jgi:hypothetical protein
VSRRNVTIKVAMHPDGTREAWAVADKMNGAIHEAEVTPLTITDNAIKGEVTVVFCNDQWVGPHPITNGPLAARYRIDASIAEGKLSGTYAASLGVALDRGVPAMAIRHNRDIQQNP